MNPDTRLNALSSKENLLAFARAELERREPGWMVMNSPGEYMQKLLAGNVHESVQVIPVIPIPWESGDGAGSSNIQSDRAQLRLNRWRGQLTDAKAFRVMVVYPGTVNVLVGMVTEQYILTPPPALRMVIDTLRNQAADTGLGRGTREDRLVQIAATETVFLIKTGKPYAAG
jgi:hypothetical protein